MGRCSEEAGTLNIISHQWMFAKAYLLHLLSHPVLADGPVVMRDNKITWNQLTGLSVAGEILWMLLELILNYVC